MRQYLLSTVFTVAVGIPGLAVAQGVQTPSSSSPYVESDASVVDAIIVTAQKREQRLQDVGQTIAVLSGSELEERGVRSLNELASAIPTLTVTRTEFNTPVLSLRGVGFYENSIAGSPAVTLYVDQVPISFVAESAGVLFDMQRVEVLKGPQGTLFGQNSTGGAINFIAAKPTREFAAGASLSYGSYNALEGTAYVSGPISSTLSARLSAQVLRGGAWQRSHTRGDERGDRDLTSARLILDWRPTDRLNASLTLSGWTDRADTIAAQYISSHPFSPITPFRPGPADETTNSNNRDADWDPGVDLTRHDRRKQIALQISYDLTDELTLTSITAASDYKYRNITDMDGTAFQNGLNRLHGDTDSFFQEARISATFDRYIVTAGVNYQKDNAFEYNDQDAAHASTLFVLGPPFPITDFVVSDRHRIESKAAFANVEAEVGRGLTLIGGARYTKDTRKYSFCGPLSTGLSAFQGLRDFLRAGAGLPPGRALSATDCLPIGPPPLFEIGPPAYSSIDADNLSWRATAQLKPNEDMLLYASVSRGYKSGTFPLSANVFSAGIRPVEQEQLTSYEAGFKYTGANGLVFNGSAFYYDYIDKQIKGNVPTLFGPLLSLISVPKSRIMGAEAEFRVQPLEGLTISASAAYLNSEVVRDYFNIDAYSNTFNFKGQTLPFTPEWSFDFDAEYQHRITEEWNAYIGAHLNYASDSRAQFFDPADPAFELFDLPARSLLDARLGVENDRYKFELWGRNLTDEYYTTNVYKGIDTLNQITGLSRTYGASISVKY